MHTYNYCGFNFESLSTDTEKSQTIMIEPEEIGNSHSSKSSTKSSTYGVFSISRRSESSIGSVDYALFTPSGPVVQIPRPHIYYHKNVFIGDSGEYTKIGSSTETGEKREPNDRSYIPGFDSMILTRTDCPIRPVPPDEDNKKPDTNINREQGPPNDRSYIPGFDSMILTRTDDPVAPVEETKKPDTNSNWRRIKPVVLVVVICLSVSALVAIIVANKNVDDPVPTPFTQDEPSAVKCKNQESVVSPGDPICIPYDLNSTSRISHITMQQTSSTYFYTFFQFNMSVSSTVSHFIRYVDDWIVDYNISRTDQMLRIVQPNSYCSNTGKYIVILEYTDGSNHSFEFEVRMKDPQLNQSITSDDQGIHVHCELTGTCLSGSLAIYVTVNNSTLLVPDTNACSYNDRKTGTMVSIQATIPFSMITKNQSISCVPLMRNQELAENLTNTIPTCDEPECKPNCKDVSTNTGTYYPNSVYCDKFYQCDNGEAKEHTCGKGAYWEPTKCTCDHYNTTICNMNNNTRITPLRTLIPCNR